MMLQISSLLRSFSGRAFSTLSGLPRRGRMAWYMRCRPHLRREVVAARGRGCLEPLPLGAVVIEGARQGAAEATQVGAADRVVCVVGVAADAFLLARCVLQRYLDADLVERLLDVDRL